MAEVTAGADHIEEVVALVACHYNSKQSITTMAAEAAASEDLASSCSGDIHVTALTLVRSRAERYY